MLFYLLIKRKKIGKNLENFILKYKKAVDSTKKIKFYNLKTIRHSVKPHMRKKLYVRNLEAFQ